MKEPEAPLRGLWRPPLWLGFLWGFAEGTLFFIIPDIVLSWAALAGAKCGAKTLGAILLGAVVAGLCLHTWATFQPEASRSVVAAVPWVRTAMFEKVQTDYENHGISGILMGPASGIPYKVYAVLAPPFCPAGPFALISIVARAERMALTWVFFTALGLIFRRWLVDHRRLTVTLFAAFWIVVYAFYWTMI